MEREIDRNLFEEAIVRETGLPPGWHLPGEIETMRLGFLIDHRIKDHPDGLNLQDQVELQTHEDNGMMNVKPPNYWRDYVNERRAHTAETDLYTAA